MYVQCNRMDLRLGVKSPPLTNLVGYTAVDSY